jgi:hypothetical protein
MSMCITCSWILHRSGGFCSNGGVIDAADGANSGCDIVAAVFGLASGVCSVVNLGLPIPYDRAPQVRVSAPAPALQTNFRVMLCFSSSPWTWSKVTCRKDSFLGLFSCGM